MASERQDIHGLKREQPKECRAFLVAVIKDRIRLLILTFFNELLTYHVPKFVFGYGFLEHFIP